jgi:hypothetical protein
VFLSCPFSRDLHTQTVFIIALLKVRVVSMGSKHGGVATCTVGDRGACALAEALKTNSSLTVLSLDHNRITDGGGTALAEALTHNTSLRKLLLDGNTRLTDDTLVRFATSLKTNNVLQELDLSGLECGPVGGQALGTILMHNRCLRSLECCGMPGKLARMGDAGAAALAKALQSNESCTALNIKWHDMTEAGRRKIQAAVNISTTLVQFSGPDGVELPALDVRVRNREAYLNKSGKKAFVLLLLTVPFKLTNHLSPSHLSCLPPLTLSLTHNFFDYFFLQHIESYTMMYEIVLFCLQSV